ncbi:hypothetical protein ABAC460_05680 [Asticcacaulis sp. AC460]|uniref:hypothetical protein n=1 Tax=Asticcacaulis sp. AC460 TaxID=1282360 RepID=UPI0003C3B3E6|nr:hypothetical protein [Asticcacaulis sp. AC460]ESQ91473.1 hypothetical protein ABAC460_05680 [Asticcacaulis sp. AC460]
MDQNKLDGKSPKRAWFARHWGRVWPWSPVGWGLTLCFFAAFIGLLVYTKRIEAAGGDTQPWFLGQMALFFGFSILVYATSRKP